MITLYSGTPGSGKSLHVAKHIREKLTMKNTVVVGNFQINRASVKKLRGVYLSVDNYRITTDRLIKLSQALSRKRKRPLKEGEILLVIDEAQLLFNSRDWQMAGRSAWTSFFTQHRKLGYEIILITQFDRMLDKQIRCLIEYEIIHRKVSNAGKFGGVLGFLMRGNIFCAIKRWYPIGEKVDMNFYHGNKRDFAFYDTFNMFSYNKTAPVKKKEKSLPVTPAGVGLKDPTGGVAGG